MLQNYDVTVESLKNTVISESGSKKLPYLINI